MSETRLRRILYVEDDPDIQEVARIALSVVGDYDVEICSSGTEAIDAAGRVRPDVVLLDVMMPGMDGVSTMAALRGVPGLEDVPVIFVTAKVQAAEISQYRKLGALDVISKPFDPMTLAEEIRTIWINRGRRVDERTS